MRSVLVFIGMAGIMLAWAIIPMFWAMKSSGFQHDPDFPGIYSSPQYSAKFFDGLEPEYFKHLSNAVSEPHAMSLRHAALWHQRYQSTIRKYQTIVTVVLSLVLLACMVVPSKSERNQGPIPPSPPSPSPEEPSPKTPPPSVQSAPDEATIRHWVVSMASAYRAREVQIGRWKLGCTVAAATLIFVTIALGRGGSKDTAAIWGGTIFLAVMWFVYRSASKGIWAQYDRDTSGIQEHLRAMPESDRERADAQIRDACRNADEELRGRAAY